MRRTLILTTLLVVSTFIASPAVAKEGRTLTDPQWLEEFRAAMSAGESSAVDEVQRLKDVCKWWMDKDDEFIWNLVPDLQAPRVGHVSFKGCPICGAKIFEGRGHYPWIWNPDRPYKVQCPLCKTVFPTNDYHEWMLGGRKEKLDTTQPYVDDGSGYVAPDGEHYYFVGYVVGMGNKPCVWAHVFNSGIHSLARLFLLTGEEVYAHKCALLLARIATEYPSLNDDLPDNLTEEQIRHLEYRHPPAGPAATIGGYQIEVLFMKIAFTAYDDIYPYLARGGDGELRAFLAGKGVTDVKSHIESNYLNELLIAVLRGNYVSGDSIVGLQNRLAIAAAAWDQHDPGRGVTSEYLLDWILHSGPRSVDTWLYNEFDRDGFGPCESLYYNFVGGIQCIVPFAQSISDAGLDLFALPRIREVIRLPIKTTVAGKWYPSIGDGGGAGGYPAGGRYWDYQYMGPPFEAYGDPLLARAIFASVPRLYDPAYGDNPGPEWEHLLPKVEQTLNRFGREMTWESRNYSAFGLAILESGEGDLRRGLTCYYGGNTAHGNWDRLTMSLFSHSAALTPDLGYPHMGSIEQWGWTSHTSSHNTVVVDARRQLNREPGTISLFAVTPTVQAVEVDGQASYRGIVSKYNRTLVWVDVDEANSYLVDIFRVAGGSQHDYSFHASTNSVTVDSLSLATQDTGTLAGPDIEYADFYDGEPSQHYRGSGFQYLYDVQAGIPVAGFAATWSEPGGDKPLLRVHVPAGVAEQVFFANGLPPFHTRGRNDIRYMLLRRGHCPSVNEQHDEEGTRIFPVGNLESTFVTVIEPLVDEPFITSVERLTRIEGLGPEDVALSIKRADGFVDVLVCLEDWRDVTLEGITITGRIGLLTTDLDGDVTRLALLDGTVIAQGETSLQAQGPFEGHVGSVDYEAMTLTVPEKLPPGDELAGRTIILTIPPRTTAFTIDSVEEMPGGSRIKLRELDAIAYRAKVEAAGNDPPVVVLDSPISIYHSGTALAGMRLYNEDHSRNTVITAFSRRADPNMPWPPFGGTAYVEGGFDLEQAFTDVDGDGRIMAHVYEFGPGDAYRIAPTAYLAQEH